MRIANQIAAEMLKKYPFVFRNSVGMATDNKGHKFKFGLYPGSSDYIGFIDEKTYAPDGFGIGMIPRFASIEIKCYGDKLSPKQRKWNKVMQEHNCIVEVWSEDSKGNIIVKIGKDII
jgi:hypothetical protein